MVRWRGAELSENSAVSRSYWQELPRYAVFFQLILSILFVIEVFVIKTGNG